MKTMLPRSPNDPEYSRQASDLKWMKGGQKGGIKGKRDRTRRGDLREKHKNTRTQGKRTQIEPILSNNNISLLFLNVALTLSSGVNFHETETRGNSLGNIREIRGSIP